jgi:hypothetical protein
MPDMIYLERDEVRRLLTVARKHSELHYAALLVSFLHGLRVSEALKIKGADICDGKLSVTRKKRSKATLHDLRIGGDPLFDESSVLALAEANPGRLFDWTRPFACQCRYALIARIAELQPVAFRPFSRIRMTASCNSILDGESDRSHFRLCLYHSTVAGVTLCRYVRSRMKSVNMSSPNQVLKIRK